MPTGYHQIPLYAADQEKTAFITPRGTYCYKVMPFGLKNAGATYQRLAIKEVHYPEWLATTVVVKKKTGKWRVCMDFTDLNKACPKDSFPLPKIDQLIDATAGHDRMSFLDAYRGYHQIPLYVADQEKTTFITP